MDNQTVPEQQSTPTATLWVTVGEAVAQTGVRERTLYRLVKTGRLPSQPAENGQTLVDLAAAKALAAAARQPPRPVPGAVAAGQTSTLGGGRLAADKSRAAEDGDLAARVFQRLSEGAKPVDLVEELRIAPERVRALAREFRALKSEEERAPVAPQLPDRWQELSDRVTAVALHQGHVEEFGDHVTGIGERVQFVEQQLDSIVRTQREHWAIIRRLNRESVHNELRTNDIGLRSGLVADRTTSLSNAVQQLMEVMREFKDRLERVEAARS